MNRTKISSSEVAKMMGKEHNMLLRDIRNYILQMMQANEESPNLESPIKPTDYFIESTYINSQNKSQPCYDISRIGCDFIANKLHGVKGTAFTAEYVKRFYEMEHPYKLPATYPEALRQLADEVELRKRIEGEIKKKDEVIEHKENIIINLVDEVSLAEKRQVLNRLVRYKGADFKKRWRELYKQFSMKYHINLNIKLENYNRVHKPKLRNKLDYIDKIMGKLPEIYEIACKLYENDVKELVQEIYELNKHNKRVSI